MAKEYLIIEKSAIDMKIVEESPDGKYIVLEGTFGEIGVRNKNKRIYSEEEYVPQVKSLQEKIGNSRLLGELDHPKDFEITLSNVSHVIEKLQYDKETKKVTGRIRILNTPKGQIAQSLVRDKIPLHISSRAAGSVNEQGHVSIKKLITYDLVADPGFENARLNEVNEAKDYGFDDSTVFICEVNSHQDDDKYKNNIDTMSDKNTNVSMDDFSKYSNYVKEKFVEFDGRIKEIQDSLEDQPPVLEHDDSNIRKYVNYLSGQINNLAKYTVYLSEHVDNTITHNDDIVESMDKMTTYLDYVKEEVNTLIDEHNDVVIEQEKLEDKIYILVEKAEIVEDELYNSVDYMKYLAEETDKGLQYMEHVAEKTDQSLQYSEYLSEMVDKSIIHGNYISEEMNGVVKYTDYLKENLNLISQHSNTVSEKVNDIVDVVNVNKLDNKLDDVTPNSDDKDIVITNENYQSGINGQLQEILESAKKKKAENESYKFINLLEEKQKSEFISFPKEKREEIVEKFKTSDYKTKAEAFAIYESLAHPAEVTLDYVENMPEKYKTAWEALTEGERTAIKAQANFHVLESEYQIKNFWDTRDLRTMKIPFQAINENENADDKTATPTDKTVSNNYLEDFKKNMSRRFN